MLKKNLLLLVRFVLIFSFVFPSSLLSYNNIDVVNFDDHSYSYYQTQKDLSLLTKQYRIEFSYQNGERIITRKIPLIDLNLDLDRPSILNPSKDLRYEYHKESKELWIVLSSFNNKTQTYEDSLAHVFKDTELTSPVAVDSNMIVFATTSGIRATLIERIVNSGFIEPILVPLVLPKITDARNATVSNIEFIVPNKDYSSKLEDPNLVIHSGDLLLEIHSQTPGGYRNIDYTILDRSSIILNLRNQLIGTLFLASFYLDRKDQKDLIYQIENCLSNEHESIKNFIHSGERILSESFSDNLLTHVLKNIASGNKLKSALSLVQSSSDSTDFLTEFSKSLRLTFSVEDSKNISILIDNYKKRFGSISKKKEEELKVIYFKLKSEKALSENQNLNSSTNKESRYNPDTTLMIEFIQNEALKYKKQHLQSSSWIESVSKDILDKESLLQEASLKEENIFKNLMTSTSNLWKCLTSKLKKNIITVAISTAIASFYISLHIDGVDVGLDTITGIFKGIWNILNYSTEVPILSTLTDPIKGLWSYLSEGWFAGIKLVLGVAIGLAIYPLSLYLIKLTKSSSSQIETLWQTFFNFGVRIYAKLCYPLVKFLWDTLNQKYLYHSLDIGLTPIHNNPFTSDESIKEEVNKKIQNYSKKQDISFISKIIAACIVAESSEIDIRSLLLLESGMQIKTVVALLEKTSIDSLMLSGIENLVYSSLLEIAQNKNIDDYIDELSLSQYIKVYIDIKDRIKANDKVKFNYFKKTYLTFKKSLSQQIIPYILYGKQGLDFYNKYKNVMIDPSTASIAGVDYRNDYIFSTFIYAGVDTEKFSIGNLGNAEVLANEIGHSVIHGIEGAVDPLSVAEESIFNLSEEYKSLSSQIYSYDKKQGFLEGIKTMFSNSSILSSIGYFDNHAKYIVNLITGFNVRFLSDYLTRVFGLIITMIIASETFLTTSDMLSCTIKCIFLSSFFLVSRISFGSSFLGYAVVWPYILLGMKKNRNSCLFNKKVLEEVSFLIDNGIRFNNIELARKGALILKSIYYFSHTDLPLEYRKPIESFSFEDIKRFNDYTKSNLPISTRINHGIDFILTVVIGAWISTVLFTILSERLYDMNLSVMDSLELLGSASIYLGLSYIGLKTLSYIIKTMFDLNKDKEEKDTSLDKKEKDTIRRIDSDFNYSSLSLPNYFETIDTSREHLVKVIDVIKEKDCTSYFRKD